MCEQCRSAMSSRTTKEAARKSALLHGGKGAGAGAKGAKKPAAKKAPADKGAANANATKPAAGKGGTGPKTVAHGGYAGGAGGSKPKTVVPHAKGLESDATSKGEKHRGYESKSGPKRELAAQQQAAATSSEKKACTCTKPHRPAANFRELVALLRLAEQHLTDLGDITDPGERLAILRGIFYGPEWSLDYIRENSKVRNLAFCIYTGATQPQDPRPFMPCGLYDALQKSQDTADGTRKLDIGHVMIGIDARRSWLARTRHIPTQGGSGLDISTWLGDLGGGSALLALGRVKNPKMSALTKFQGGDFGGSSNLEGDVAGFLVGLDESHLDGPSAPQFPAGKGVADAFEAYLEPAGPGKVWNGRAAKMLRILGGKLDGSNALTNRAELVEKVAAQIEEFSEWYLINRLRQKERLDTKLLRDAGLHLVGASQEVSAMFIDALVRAAQRARINIAASNPPAPTPAAAEIPHSFEVAVRAIEGGQGAVDKAKDGWHKATDYLKSLDFNPFD